MTFYPLEKTGKLQDDYRETFRVAGRHLLLLQHEGKPHLVDNICPHAGYPLQDGLVIDGKLRCPMHGYLFELGSGACMMSSEGPCNGIQVYEVTVIGDDLGVML
jgi:nitrite reductase/ring-hydroxylating ferredoxin subunit